MDEWEEKESQSGKKGWQEKREMNTELLVGVEPFLKPKISS